MKPEDLDALLTVARKHGVRGATISENSVEFVFEPAPPPPKEKPTDELEPVGAMPTRAEIEATRDRIAKGAIK